MEFPIEKSASTLLPYNGKLNDDIEGVQTYRINDLPGDLKLKQTTFMLHCGTNVLAPACQFLALGRRSFTFPKDITNRLVHPHGICAFSEPPKMQCKVVHIQRKVCLINPGRWIFCLVHKRIVPFDSDGKCAVRCSNHNTLSGAPDCIHVTARCPLCSVGLPPLESVTS